MIKGTDARKDTGLRTWAYAEVAKAGREGFQMLKFGILIMNPFFVQKFQEFA
jgi:hypothetical protein